jgi:hypothetical protein
MARKSKSRDKGKKIDIQFLRQRDGYASDRHDWVNHTGNSFRPKGENGKKFPHQRPADISK